MTEEVKLISSDGKVFIISKEHAIQSKTLNTFFNTNSSFVEHRTKEVMLPIKSIYLSRIIEYLDYKYKNRENEDVEEFEVNDEETVDLLDAAAYLRI